MSDLRSCLQAVYDQHGGRLTPALVVAEARDESHPLHDRFEWDDRVAGEQYRLVQAHELIRSVKVVYHKASGPKDSDRSVRQWHSIRRPDGYSYEPVEVVVADPVLTEILKRDMEREWRSLKTRYGHFVEFVEMVKADVSA